MCLLPLGNNNYFSLTNGGFVPVCQQCFYSVGKQCFIAVGQRTLDAVGEQLILASKTTKSLVRDLQKRWPNVTETPLLEPDSISTEDNDDIR